MKDVTVRQLEMVNRVVTFLRENPIVFRKGSPGADLVQEIQDQAAKVGTLTATQAAQIATACGYSWSRGAARESLNAEVERISHTAHAIAISDPSLGAQFNGTERVGDAKLETRARALVDSAKPHVQKFVAFEMNPKFIQTLEAKIQAFTLAVANHKASRVAHVATSQMINSAMAHALTILEQLDPIIENKFGGDIGLKLKWENVRQVERRCVYKKTEEAAPESAASMKTTTADAPIVPMAPAA